MSPIPVSGVWVALALALLLPGCASLIPPFMKPAPPVADRYPAVAIDSDDTVSEGLTAEDPTTEVAAQPPADWQAFFTDAALRRLIDAALTNNRDLRLATLNIARVHAQQRQQRAARWPQLDAEIDASRQINRNSDDGGGGSRGDTRYFAGATLSAFELDLFGRLKSLDLAAQARVLASSEAQRTVQIGLIAEVANGWIEAQAARLSLEQARATVASRSQSLELARLQFKHGVVAEIDVVQVDSLLAAARAVVAAETRRVARADNALTLLVGGPLPSPDQAAPAFPVVRDVAAGLPAALLERRPDIREAEQALIAANAQIGAARAAFFPQIALTAQAGLASNALDQLFSASGSWGFGVNLLQPLFNAGRNRALLDESNIDRDAAVARYEQTIQQAFREVADALAGRSTLLDERAAREAVRSAETRRSELVQLRFDAGEVSRLEILDAERARFDAERAAINVQALELQNRVDLFRALGGGWSDTRRLVGEEEGRGDRVSER